VLPVAAVVLGWASVRGVGFAGITDLGLVSVLPAGYFVALAVLAAGFVAALRGRERPLLLGVQVLAAVLLLYGVTVLIEQVPRFNVVYRHAGVIDHLLRGGPLDPGIDAYFNWPGFFLFGEFLVELAGLEGVLPIASYAPMVVNLLILPALVVIARSAAGDWRTAWVGVWIFYLCNWVGQDYLAPQAYAFVLYVTLSVALLTTLAGRWKGPMGRWRRRAGAGLRALGRRLGAAADPVEVSPARPTALQCAGVVLACTLLLAGMVPSHQLTPFAALLMVTALVLLRRTTARLLPLIAVVLIAGWLSFQAVEFLSGNLQELLAEAFNLEGSLGANVGQRVSGSAEHLAIVYLRITVAGALWALATVGIVRMLRHGRAAPSHAVLALLPLALVPLQPYGGEVLLRAYLFALPFVAVLVAWALFPGRGTSWSWRRSSALLLISCLLMGSFLFTRYGNERAALFTAREREAVTRLYQLADPGDMLVAGVSNTPWQDQQYNEFNYTIVNRLLEAQANYAATRPTPPGTAPPNPGQPPPGETPTQLAQRIAEAIDDASGDAQAYLIITRSQRSYDQMFGSRPWGSVLDLEQGAQQSPRYQVLYANPDATVFTLRKTP
jgi:hypothetical protein